MDAKIIEKDTNAKKKLCSNIVGRLFTKQQLS